MDEALHAYLKNHNIKFREYGHPAVFTVAESNKLDLKIPAMHTKSLFLKDENNHFYLVCMPADIRLNTKLIKNELNIKELHFASPEELKQILKLTPGSVSIFGAIYSDSITLLLDKNLWNSENVGFHPNINTATLVLSHLELKKFYDSLKCEKRIIKL
jgi:Ala-tRNA(Pro) deacylase